jgi:hypothetical protein
MLVESDTSSLLAAIASAVAAAFSALAAFMTWHTQVRQLRESVRPELAISDWSRCDDTVHNLDIVRFSKIKNVGRGAARNIVISSFGLGEDGRPTSMMNRLDLPTIAAGETADVECCLILQWGPVAKHGPGSKVMPTFIRVRCWDSVGVRHDATTHLILFQKPVQQPIQNYLADGIGFSHYESKSESVRHLKLKRWAAELPGMSWLQGCDA